MKNSSEGERGWTQENQEEEWFNCIEVTRWVYNVMSVG